MFKLTTLGLLACAALFAPAAFSSDCKDYAKHLKTCAAFECTFKHPITGKPMKKKIIGTAAGKCRTTEEMPGNGRMECNFSPATQAAVTSEMEILAAAEATEAHGTTDAHYKATTTLKADGKEVVNALEKAMNDRECVVSGY
jgi:hypothetical protein